MACNSLRNIQSNNIYSDDDEIHKISRQSYHAEDLYKLDSRIPRKLIYQITDKIFKNQCVDD